jgi:hypothetical protein
MSLSKSAERAAMEKVAAILLPISMHTDTYGVGAMMDTCQAWARALDTDMPLECFLRDRMEVQAANAANVKACAAALERANMEAARIIKAAEDKAQRISRICHDNARMALKAMEGV